MDSTKIEPNDVAIILRPSVKEGKEWNGNFELLIAGYGPFSITEDSVRDLVGMAMLIASAVPMMESSVDFTEKLMEMCQKVYGEPDDVINNSVSGVLTSDTKCYGGMQ